MKQLFTLAAILSLTILSSCYVGDPGPVGPQGPQGPQGIQGEQGDSGFVFEWENVNFTAPNYEVILPYDDFSFEGFDSDVALVYFHWGTEEVNGEVLDIWRQLPQTVITPDGLLQYNFDFTKYDVRLFLDATYSLDLLTAIDTDNWIVRVVVVPGEFWNGRIDTSNYYDVVEQFGLQTIPVKGDITPRR